MDMTVDTNRYVSTIADKALALRKALGLTQEALGKRAGYPNNPRVYVAKIERGDNKLSTVAAREQFAQGVGLEIDALGAYLDGKKSLEDVLGNRPLEPIATSAHLSPVEPVIDEAQSPLEAALANAFNPKKHTLKDLDAVRASLRKTHQWQAEDADFVEAARTWLDAAARLRRAGKPVDAESLVYALTLGTKALPHQIERAEQRDAAETAEAEAELRALGGEPGQGAAMGERLKRLAKKAQGAE